MSVKGFLRLLLVLAIPVAIWFFWPWRALRTGPGVLVKQEPVQTAIAPRPLGVVEDWNLTAMASYDITGRVLGTKRYHSGTQSGLVPLDVALGWGRMSDEDVLDHFTLSMSNRFFFYKWYSYEPYIPQDEIMRSASNNHVIAANSEVRSVLRWLRPGQIVRMKGYLVNAETPGNSWHSSLRRDDTGNGACELFYVESAEVLASGTVSAGGAGK